MTQCFIFGYGSLISRDSRDISGESGKSIPVRISGIRRGWNLVIPRARAVALGAAQEAGVSCNGVIFSVGESEMPKFDDRELKHGYTKIALDRSWVSCPDGKPVPQGEIIAYASTTTVKDAPRDVPLVQSYIDVIMTGCLETFGETFAREFVRTTDGWDKVWDNDRLYPRYDRPMKEVPLAETIDRILAEEIPQFFSWRKDVFAWPVLTARWGSAEYFLSPECLFSEFVMIMEIPAE
jgi:hypothetical protein